MPISQNGINIGTISGGIVNFGGAVYIAPISVTKSITGTGGGNTGSGTTTGSILALSNAATAISNLAARTPAAIAGRGAANAGAGREVSANASPVNASPRK